jgi:TPR repeat protein
VVRLEHRRDERMVRTHACQQRQIPYPENMKVFGLIVVCAVVWLAPGGTAFGQVSDSEKRQFAQTKAQAEHGNAPAQFSLGNMYANGVGVSRDTAKAAKWYRRAAEQGLARAELKVAFDFADGVGVKSDHNEAIKWLRRAADQGLAEAQQALGVCYSKGDAVAEDAVEATRWYRKAADQNLAEAQYALGTCYFEGNGVTKDIAEGVAWTRKAAEQGLAEAEDSLGMCYAKGKGVPQDYLQAYKWFNLAAAQGTDNNVQAKMNLSMAERAMTPEQIAKGQQMAHEFKPNKIAQNSARTPVTNAAARGEPNNSGQFGFLNVKADDDTYEVYADGVFVGNSPAKLKLAPGSHTIEVKRAGFKDFRRQITISEGSEQTLRASLE